MSDNFCDLCVVHIPCYVLGMEYYVLRIAKKIEYVPLRVGDTVKFLPFGCSGI